MGSKIKLFYVLVRNKMPSVLPPFAPLQKISLLMALVKYLWGCYQALMGNYQVLQDRNDQLQKRVAEADMRASAAEQCAAAAEQKIIVLTQKFKEQLDDAYYALDNAISRQEELEKELKILEDDFFCQDRVQASVISEFDLYSKKLWKNHKKGNNTATLSCKVQTNFINGQTQSFIDKENKIRDLKHKLDALKRNVQGCIFTGFPTDVVTLNRVKDPVIVIPSLENVNPKIMDFKSYQELSRTLPAKFPYAQGATITGVHSCADVNMMLKAMQQVLKLCDCDLDE
jgi:hypothetical protein